MSARTLIILSQILCSLLKIRAEDGETSRQIVIRQYTVVLNQSPYTYSEECYSKRRLDQKDMQ